jgi:ATP-dependent Clp protease ATP-binding subunit ClpA
VFDRFSDAARTTVTLAEEEARRLGHGQVGTEHLLLGLVADEESPAARVLIEAGATLSGCRSKTREAVGATTAVAPAAELPLTDRAQRALERADRLSIRRRDGQVEPSHILLSVLDVEGRAGQVLRGLSVDVVGLREAVLSAMDTNARRAAPTPLESDQAMPRCTACGVALEGFLSHRLLTSRDAAGNARELVIAYCSACGTAVGTMQR